MTVAVMDLSALSDDELLAIAGQQKPATPSTLDLLGNMTQAQGGGAPSPLGSAGREAVRSVLPAGAGILSGAGTGAGLGALGANPITIGLGTVLGGLAGAFGTRFGQDAIADAIAPDSIFGTKSAQEDYQTNPMSTVLGGAIAGGRPSVKNLAQAGKGLFTAEGRALTLQGLKAIGNAERAAAAPAAAMRSVNSVLDVGTGSAINAGITMAQGGSPLEVIRDGGIGALFNRPWFNPARIRGTVEPPMTADAVMPDPGLPPVPMSPAEASAQAMQAAGPGWGSVEFRPPVEPLASPEGIDPQSPNAAALLARELAIQQDRQRLTRGGPIMEDPRMRALRTGDGQVVGFDPSLFPRLPGDLALAFPADGLPMSPDAPRLPSPDYSVENAANLRNAALQSPEAAAQLRSDGAMLEAASRTSPKDMQRGPFGLGRGLDEVAPPTQEMDLEAFIASDPERLRAYNEWLAQEMVGHPPEAVEMLRIPERSSVVETPTPAQRVEAVAVTPEVATPEAVHTPTIEMPVTGKPVAEPVAMAVEPSVAPANPDATLPQVQPEDGLPSARAFVEEHTAALNPKAWTPEVKDTAARYMNGESAAFDRLPNATVKRVVTDMLSRYDAPRAAAEEKAALAKTAGPTERKKPMFGKVSEWADETIKASRTRMNSMPVDIYAAYAVKGAELLTQMAVGAGRRIADLATWKREMNRVYPEVTDEKMLKRIYDTATRGGAVLDGTMDSMTTGRGPLVTEFANNVKTLLEAVRNSKSFAESTRHTIKMLVVANGTFAHSLADGTSSPAMERLASLVAPAYGREGKAQGMGLADKISHSARKRINQFSEVLKPLEKELSSMNEVQRNVLFSRLGRSMLLDDAKLATMGKGGQVVMKLKAMRREMLNEMRALNPEVGDAGHESIWRQFDMSVVMNDKDGFITQAAKAYVAAGTDAADARPKAEKLYDAIVQAEMDLSLKNDEFIRGEPGDVVSNTVKGREWNDAANGIMDKYYNWNVHDLFMGEINRHSRRTALWDAFGQIDPAGNKGKGSFSQNGQWETLKNSAIAEMQAGGMSEADAMARVAEMKQIIQSSIGNLGGLKGERAQAIMDGIRLWTSLAFLPRATLSSLAEPINIGMRTDSPIMGGLRAIADTQVELWRRLLGKDKSSWTETMETLGAVSEDIHQAAMVNMLMSSGTEGRRTSIIQNWFFSKIGLHQFDNSARVAAGRAGARFFNHLVGDLKRPSFQELAASRLRGLGIDAAQHAAFSRYVEGLRNAPDLADAIRSNTTAEGEMYRSALARFVSESVMSPNASSKPRHWKSPMGQLSYSLMGYLFDFHEKVNKRMWRQFGEAVRPGSGMTAPERVRVGSAVLAYYPLAIGAAFAIDQLKGLMMPDSGRKEREPWQHFLNATVRSGLTGKLDPILSQVGAGRGFDPSAMGAGAALNMLFGMVNSASGMVVHNSDKTNNAEYKFARSGYKGVIQPALNAAISTLPNSPLVNLLAMPTIQAVSSPTASNAFGTALGGAPKYPGKKGPFSSGMMPSVK